MNTIPLQSKLRKYCLLIVWLHILLQFISLFGNVNCREAVFDMFKGKIYIDKFILPCPEAHQQKNYYPIYYDNISVSGRSGVLRIDYDIIIKQAVGTPFTLSVDIQRCKSRESPDSCIKFAVFKTNRLCNLLDSRREFWTPMITCCKPTLSCPLSVRSYHGRNCTIDMSGFNWFPLGDAYWKLRLDFLWKSKTVACGLVEGKYVPH